jgi:beta-galactosidase
VLDVSGSETVSWNDVNVGQQAMLSHWNFPLNSHQKVFVFTNAAAVELVYNGVSLGTKPNDGQGKMQHVITWDVDYQQGGSLMAIARDANGKEMARHALQTAGKAVRLIVEPETSQLNADGKDLIYLNVTAVDKKGRVVPDYDQPLMVNVEGAATLLALDNGDHYTDELFAGISSKKMLGGRMQVILRSKREAGKVMVKVESAHLKGSLKTSTKLNSPLRR